MKHVSASWVKTHLELTAFISPNGPCSTDESLKCILRNSIIHVA